MEIPDHLTHLLRNLCAAQEATVRNGHGTIDWFQTGKGVRQGCILSLCIFNLYAEYIMRNPMLNEAQPGIKIAGRNISNLRYADDTACRKWRKTKQLLDESEKGEWKSWLKTQHSENKDHGSHRWVNNANSDRFLFSQTPKSLQMVTAAVKLKDPCSLEEKLWPT